MSKASSSYEVRIGVIWFLVFALKLTGFIDCSWWWVFWPIWLPGALVVGSMILLTLFVIVAVAVICVVGLFQ